MVFYSAADVFTNRPNDGHKNIVLKVMDKKEKFFIIITLRRRRLIQRRNKSH